MPPSASETSLTMRVARPADNLAAIRDMYMRGLGLEVLGNFTDHDGFDGVMLGLPGEPYHLEFTAHRGHPVGRAPTQDNLLVFYYLTKLAGTCAVSRCLRLAFKK